MKKGNTGVTGDIGKGKYSIYRVCMSPPGPLPRTRISNTRIIDLPLFLQPISPSRWPPMFNGGLLRVTPANKKKGFPKESFVVENGTLCRPTRSCLVTVIYINCNAVERPGAATLRVPKAQTQRRSDCKFERSVDLVTWEEERGSVSYRRSQTRLCSKSIKERFCLPSWLLKID